MFKNYIFYFFIFFIPSIICGGLLIIAGNISDGIRLFGLCLPSIFLIYFYLKTSKKALKYFIVLWTIFFISDSLLRSSTWFLLNSDTDSYFIIEAIANTNKNETFEFLTTHIYYIFIYTLILILFLTAYFFILFSKTNFKSLNEIINSKIGYSLKYFCYLLILLAYSIEPSRNLHPIIYWYEYQQKVKEFASRIERHQEVHELWDKTAKQNLVIQNNRKKQTHVLVITDSVTSLNLGICGYNRNTTPNLKKRLSTLKVYCNAYSAAASTIPSLKTKLTDTSNLNAFDYSSKSLLAYAKNSGFKIYWLSNQNDIYISSLFGNYANTAIYKNNRSGRSSQSLDESLLVDYEKALNDSYPKKLIILHFIGAHPNYEKRYPSNFNVFNHDTNDKIEFLLESKNINSWIQHQRHHYDNAILYQDYLIDKTLTLLQSQSNNNQFSSFIFVSDHGNEVGHNLNYAGHSPDTKAGYLVPIIIWHDKQKNKGVDLAKKLYTQDLDNNMMYLMGISAHPSRPNQYWFD
ncbi:phosphoethanolamine transferase [Agitococcus lubricus]|uniref:Heptose-I-phosphate ethanolaminephosphotransferase n=1 Tax=Agitococcus lubricus TaxID=1077255 RepID=A0A2T5J0N1_9GAMM|nr:phosphoethanolamine transferase [Agitococcus lubricus]PTQ89898.1 heptose-I-phosphate ethanolaminephosphotransferase [Agitococcus lubricus]